MFLSNVRALIARCKEYHLPRAGVRLHMLFGTEPNWSGWQIICGELPKQQLDQGDLFAREGEYGKSCGVVAIVVTIALALALMATMIGVSFWITWVASAIVLMVGIYTIGAHAIAAHDNPASA